VSFSTPVTVPPLAAICADTASNCALGTFSRTATSRVRVSIAGEAAMGWAGAVTGGAV